MSITALNILDSVAYRRGESGNPDNAGETARRLRFLNEAIRRVMQSGYWWFLEKTASLKTTDDQEIVALPSDYREMIECRVDGIARYPMSTDEAFNYYRYPPQAFAYKYDYDNKFYYIFANELHLIPFPDSTPSVISVSTLTSSGTTATCTTATAHGLSNNEYVVIAGAVETAYNGTFKVTITSTTQFTYTLASTTTTPATGTITATKNNIIIRYYYYPTALTATTETVVVPDQYTEALVAYVWARLAHLDGERGTASDGFDEFNEILMEMKKENQRRNVWGKAVSPGEFKYTSR